MYNTCRSSLRVILEHLQHAQSILPLLKNSPLKQSEINWLLKVAWNLALQSNLYHKEMAQFFILCHQLSAELPPCESILRRQRSCQLMAASAFVQVAKTTDVQEEKVGSRRFCAVF